MNETLLFRFEKLFIIISLLCKIGDTNHVSVLILHDDELPAAWLGVEDHFIYGAIVGVKFFHVYSKAQTFFIIVAHERKIQVEIWRPAISRS